MTLFNYITSTIIIINEFVNSVCLSFLDSYIFERIIIISIIWLASGSREARMLDVTSKVIGSAAGCTFLSNY